MSVGHGEAVYLFSAGQQAQDEVDALPVDLNRKKLIAQVQSRELVARKRKRDLPCRLWRYVVEVWIRATSDSWLEELLSMTMAIASLVMLIVLLYFLDNKYLHTWRFGLTPNAVISFIITIMNACLAVPIASVLGQMKWLRLKERRQSLQKVQLLDSASRGVFGSLELLFTWEGELLGSVAAVVAVLMLFAGPFAQQIIKFPLHDEPMKGAYISRATVSHGQLRPAIDDILLSTTLQASLLSAFGTVKLQDPAYACPTGNCTWPSFSSLGFCSECVDITNKLTWQDSCSDCVVLEKYHPDIAKVNAPADGSWRLPAEYNGLSIDVWINRTFTLTTFNMTNTGPDPGDAAAPILAHPERSIVSFAIVNTSFPNLTAATAISCKLDWCVRNVSAWMTNGVFTEKMEKTSTKWVDPANIDTTEWQLTTMIQELAQPDVFKIDHSDVYGMAIFLYRKFMGSTGVFKQINFTTNSVSINQWLFESGGVFSLLYQSQNIQLAMDNLAVAFTNQLRSKMRDDRNSTMDTRGWSSGPSDPLRPGAPWSVEGQASRRVPRCQVRWAWITVPSLTVLLTIIVLGLVCYETRKSYTQIWKNSMLPVLFHGLSRDAQRRMNQLASTAQEEQFRNRLSKRKSRKSHGNRERSDPIETQLGMSRIAEQISVRLWTADLHGKSELEL